MKCSDNTPIHPSELMEEVQGSVGVGVGREVGEALEVWRESRVCYRWRML